MRRLLALLIIIAATEYGFAADEPKKYEVWITGEVFEQNHQLMFRCDKAVQGNAAGNVVYLGSSKQAANVLLPMYMKAAEQHKKLRLYGVLLPMDEKTKKGEPSVQFITWKLHLPNEPDELPVDQKILIGPNDKIPGYKVEVKSKPK